MTKYLLLGLLIFNLNVMAKTTVEAKENNNSKEEKTKTYIIDLDKERKEAKERGTIEDLIRGIIPLGHNDEVTFLGKKVLISRGIKVYINDVYQESIKVIKRTFTLKTADLKVGDKVTVKTKKGTTLVEKKVVK